MTQKEALNTLMKMRAWRAWGKEQKEEERPEMPEQKEVDEAFDVCIKLLQQPSIPSNLDEAAELSANGAMIKRQFPSVVYNTGLKCFDHSDLIKQFKAGAEWMAKQEYSQEEIVEDKSIEVGYGVLPGISPIINLPDSFKPGDKVIVQIRKKQ